MKDRLLKLISILTALVSFAFWLERVYIRYYDGNQEIKFIEYTSSGNYDYREIFQIPELKGKFIYVTLKLRGDWDIYREDLLSMDTLISRYLNSDIAFLYTVDEIEGRSQIFDWKNVIIKYNLRGYHINLPYQYDVNLWEEVFDGQTTTIRIPKYMLVSKKGEIINKWAPKPSETEELMHVIDSLLNE